MPFACIVVKILVLEVFLMNINEINPLVFAYIGDSVYELLIRNYLVSTNINDINVLSKNKINFVSANNQSKILDRLIDNNLLTEEELLIVKRARNHKMKSKPKHASIKEYKKATALEALFGTLYIKKEFNRINEIFEKIVGE